MSKQLTVLLIDDDIDDQEIFLNVLESLSPVIDCYTAGNGQEGIDKLISRQVQPNVIFLDLNMPLMNGKRFLSEMKKYDELKNIPVVILSTSSDKKMIVETKEMGAKHFITKPDRFSGWKKALEDVISRDLQLK